MQEYIVKKRDKDFKQKEKHSYKAFKKIVSKKNQKKNIESLNEMLKENDNENFDLEKMKGCIQYNEKERLKFHQLINENQKLSNELTELKQNFLDSILKRTQEMRDNKEVFDENLVFWFVLAAFAICTYKENE